MQLFPDDTASLAVWENLTSLANFTPNGHPAGQHALISTRHLLRFEARQQPRSATTWRSESPSFQSTQSHSGKGRLK